MTADTPNPAAPDTAPAPTPAQAVEIAQAGSGAIKPEQQTPEEARAAAAAAMEADAKRLAVELPPDVIDAIAATTIEKLRLAGAFDQPPATPEVPAPAPTEGGEGSDVTAPNPGDVAQPGTPAPRKRTFAERFAGKE